jgi:hypothetical protein
MIEFWEKLLSERNRSVIFHKNLVSTITSWLTEMSTVQIRGVRHTSTLIGLKLVTQICEICTKLKSELAVTEKHAQKKGNKKIIEELQSNLKFMESVVNKFFNG